MSYTDIVSRISQIQAQLAAVNTAFDPSTAASTQSTSPSATPASTSTFATALAQAQASSAIGSTSDPSLTSAAPGTSLPSDIPTTSVYPAATTTLPAAAQGMLTSGQQQFASRLASDTGLSPQTISAWMLAEESGGAATARQSAGNNDWLNIGYTDSGTYGAADSTWADPATAADATAGWLKGQNTIPGYGTASSGIQAILGTAGQTPQAQIAAIQQSGWASSGYPDLPSLLTQVGG